MDIRQLDGWMVTAAIGVMLGMGTLVAAIGRHVL